MNDGKKRRSSAELPAHKRFEKSRSRWIYPSFQNTIFVFCEDCGLCALIIRLKLKTPSSRSPENFIRLFSQSGYRFALLANLTIFGYSYRMYSVRFYLCEGAIWAE